MKIRKRFFSVFLSTLLFTGCAVNSAADNSNSIRAWFQALPWYGKVLSLGILYALILFLISRYIGAAITPAARKGLRHKWHLQEKLLSKDQKKSMHRKYYTKILANASLLDYKSTARDDSIRKLTYPEDREMLAFLSKEEANPLAIEKLPYPKERDVLVRTAMDIQTVIALKNLSSAGELAIIEKLPYPEEKETLEMFAKTANLKKVRIAALEKLTYEGSKDVIEHAVLEDIQQDVRIAALAKLTWPEAEELIIQAAMNSREYVAYRYGTGSTKGLESKMKEETDVCLKALDKLPYPQASAAIIRIAGEQKNLTVAEKALMKLCYPADRDVIINYLLEKGIHPDGLHAIFNQMPYPEAREDLIKLAVEASDHDVRREAIRKLPYPAEKQTLSYMLEHDTVGNFQEDILKQMGNSENSVKILSVTALNAKDADTRLQALKKIPHFGGHKVFLEAAQKDPISQNRRYAIEQLEYPADTKVLERIAVNDDTRENRMLARRKLPNFLEFPEAYAHVDLLEDTIYLDKSKNITHAEHMKGSIAFVIAPHNSEEIMRHLCNRIQDGIKPDAGKEKLTLAGWSAAALAKVLTAEMTPDDIALNRERFEAAVDQYNEVVQKIQPLQLGLVGKNLRYLTKSQEEDYKKVRELQKELDRGLGNFMLDNGDKPFTYLVYMLGDNQSRIPRFIKQGIIMGLLDWLMSNAEHPDVKEILESVISVRAQLIRSDDNLSFFEVRVPDDCTQEEYAELLKLVLHSANPSIRFCNTKKLLDLAVSEVPGCMKLLQQYPLRLIDTANRGTLGFYKFAPYIHEMWVQYQPPEDTGNVISRYHEVDDRTKPLSSGLNLQLFRDIYSVIPTIFHEYQHFKGDPNEASVFLKTQVFSIDFYQRYPSAKAAQDAVFARLSELLGQPPSVDKYSALNELIKQYYGEEVDTSEAMQHANDRINQLNARIYMTNLHETWDPSVKFPLLTDQEDIKNRDLIRDIIIRWERTPKSISKDTFRSIISSAKVIEDSFNEDNDHRLSN